MNSGNFAVRRSTFTRTRSGPASHSHEVGLAATDKRPLRSVADRGAGPASCREFRE